MQNPHEETARAKKVAKLVTTIDAMFESPHGVRASILLAGMAKWTPACWAELARMARVNPPSDKTVAAVTVEFQKRVGFQPVQAEIGHHLTVVS